MPPRPLTTGTAVEPLAALLAVIMHRVAGYRQHHYISLAEPLNGQPGGLSVGEVSSRQGCEGRCEAPSSTLVDRTITRTAMSHSIAVPLCGSSSKLRMICALLLWPRHE